MRPNNRLVGNTGGRSQHTVILSSFFLAVTNDMTQVVLCEREHGGGGGQEHLQAPGAGRGLAAHLIPPFLLYNLIV